jgi:hypothetical protein
MCRAGSAGVYPVLDTGQGWPTGKFSSFRGGQAAMGNFYKKVDKKILNL